MDGFKHTLEAIPEGSTRRTYGTAYWDGSAWSVLINGRPVGCRWLDPIQPTQGGNLLVDITNEGRGQYSAWVMGGYTDQPRPSTGTVLTVIPAGVSTQIVFTGEDGKEYTTDRFTGSYSPGDPILLKWDAGKAAIIGVIPSSAPPPPAAAPPPPVAVAGNGSTVLTANHSNTYNANGWGAWASSTQGREHVYAGSWGGSSMTGSWFYGTPRPELEGKTITAVRFRLPARMNAGNYNDPVTVNLYAHTSPSRPGGDVSRVAGPHTITVQPKAGPQIIDLPANFGPAIAAGGGVSIAGGGYVWFQSRLEDPLSGQTTLDWTT